MSVKLDTPSLIPKVRRTIHMLKATFQKQGDQRLYRLAYVAIMCLMWAGCDNDGPSGGGGAAPLAGGGAEGGGAGQAGSPGGGGAGGQDPAGVESEGCEPSALRCADTATLSVCQEDGTWLDQACSGGCQESDNGAACLDPVCVPGERRCQDDDTVVECNEAGSAFEIAERCQGDTTGQQCDLGECTPLCLINQKVKTNIGCDYWAADLDNAFLGSGEDLLDAAGAPFAVVVSNPHPEFTGEVSVYNHEELVDQAILPPLGLHIFNLPRRDIDGTTIAPLAYHIRSGVPIVAYQFNPLDNEEVFSNDASLLLPSHVLGTEYVVMTREQSFDSLRGYLTVVGISDEPTVVNVTVTASTQEDPLGEIPALQAGESVMVTLNAYDVLSLQTNAPGADLTGSRVIADRPVVVFGGSEAANVPNVNHCVDVDPRSGEGVCEYDGLTSCTNNYDCNIAMLNVCCADHLEQQLFPVNTWGRRYVATKSYDRGLEEDYWRVLAAFDNTKVETVPPVAVIPTLNAGEWFEFGSREHFEIVSDQPISVGQFLAGEHAPEPNIRGEELGDAGIGDPAFMLAIPSNQFRNDFVFLAPNKYARDYASVIAPVGAEVFFDDRVIEEWEPVGEGPWQVARFLIGDGVHLILSDMPVGVNVYGYDSYVSYGYPGGLNLNVVDPETGEVIEQDSTP